MKRDVINAVCLLSVVSGLWTASPVQAVPITDTVNPTDTLITAGSTPSPCPTGFTCTSGALSFVHDITDNGFNIAATVDSASIAIHLTEQVITGVNHETFRIEIGASQIFQCLSGNCVPNPGRTETIPLDALSLADLELDGMISVTIRALTGNLLFADSVLSAQVTPTTLTAQVTPAAVPEPSVVSLLLFGLLMAGRRFTKR